MSRPFLILAVLLALCVSTPAAETRPPNIIVILADDMGFSDIGCYGSEIATPNLDALAKGGLRFTQFYNTARCCPTRASLLTGLHPHQAGIGHMMEDKKLEGYRGTLNRQCVTIAEALKPAGYRNYAVGKWHVTPGQTAKALTDQGNWPLQRGFDRYYGTIHGAGSFWDPSSLVRDNKQITAVNDVEYRPKEFYYTDAISDHAVRFIREHQKQNSTQPFFLYVAYTAAHWPMHAKAADIAKYKGRYDAGYAAIRDARWAKQKQLGVVDAKWSPAPLVGNWDKVKNREFEARCMEVYAAMVDCMDQGIGRVVAELREQGQLENTLILYLQDNGGCAESYGRGPKAEPRGDRPTLPVMRADDFQFDSQPKQTRDGWPVRGGYGVMPGAADTFVAYGREWANVSNTPFREYKHWVHEGGIATPLIAHWPAGMTWLRPRVVGIVPAPLAPNQIGDTNEFRLQGLSDVKTFATGQLVDIMATCLEVAGAKYPSEFAGQKITPLEGVSLRPVFDGKSLQRSQPLFWEHEGNRAIRVGDWKLVAKGPKAAWELYNLATDRPESHNLASAEPARVKELAAKWHAWAVRANVLPSPWDKEDLSIKTHFELGPDADLSKAEAPDYVNRACTVTVGLSEPGTNGVLVAHGGRMHGWTLYFEKGVLHFAINRSGKLEKFSPADAKFASAKIITVALAADATVTLSADGHEILKRKSTGLPTTMPGEGLQVGRDLNGAVGDYQAPFAFTGKISAVTIERQPR